MLRLISILEAHPCGARHRMCPFHIDICACISLITYDSSPAPLSPILSILSDAVEYIVKEDPKVFTGHALIDEDYLRSKGVTGV